MHALIHLDFPDLSQLLVEGGDSRITPDTDGVNKYGCSVIPQNPLEELFAFGSATASTLSQASLDAAANIYQKVALACCDNNAYQVYERELDLVRQELRGLCGLDQIPGTDIVFAASGTDLHLIASQLISNASAIPNLTIMVDAAETGSSVPAALRGQHFSDRSALGIKVPNGIKIDFAIENEVVTVALRHADGLARSIPDIDSDVEALVIATIAQDRCVVLVLADVTKTGMVGPSIELAIRLRQRYPEQLIVLVDACQFRLSNTSLQAYLKNQFLVAVTGSKFLTGPSFSGALLLPPDLTRKMHAHAVPKALLAYSSRADWPRHWSGADNLKPQANFGLLLRWVAALQELRAFRALKEEDIIHFIQRFESAVLQYFDTHPALSLLEVRAPDRSALSSTLSAVVSTAQSWDSLPTIFSFVLNAAQGDAIRKPEETIKVYRQLQKDLRMSLGQPVACGMRGGIPATALRLCLSARLIVSAIKDDGSTADKIIENALDVLDRAVKLSASIIIEMTGEKKAKV